jgi:hypothetical protein
LAAAFGPLALGLAAGFAVGLVAALAVGLVAGLAVALGFLGLAAGFEVAAFDAAGFPAGLSAGFSAGLETGFVAGFGVVGLAAAGRLGGVAGALDGVAGRRADAAGFGLPTEISEPAARALVASWALPLPETLPTTLPVMDSASFLSRPRTGPSPDSRASR